MSRLGSALAAAALVVAIGPLAACSPDERDFQRKAAQIAGDQLRQQLDLDSEVTCEAPADTDRGTTFPCSAKASDGVRYAFVATITGDDSLDVRFAP